MQVSGRARFVVNIALMSAVVLLGVPGIALVEQASTLRASAFEADTHWPSVPTGWVLGEVTSVAAGPQNHIWVLHRPHSVLPEKRSTAAPPVLEFDTSGKLIRSWGGPGAGYEWPDREHAIHVDSSGFVWITGNAGWDPPTADGRSDDMILKFTSEGKFVLQIGRRGQSVGNTDTSNVHQAADVFVHTATNELFVADGYGNQRVVVFDAATGRFKRMWGAFGNVPPTAITRNASQWTSPDADASQFGLVHAVEVSNDGIVYVADRTYRRIQTFTLAGQFMREAKVVFPMWFPEYRRDWLSLLVPSSGSSTLSTPAASRSSIAGHLSRLDRMDNEASSASCTIWLQTLRAASIRLMFDRNARNVSWHQR
jgi:hypothetical protein